MGVAMTILMVSVGSMLVVLFALRHRKLSLGGSSITPVIGDGSGGGGFSGSGGDGGSHGGCDAGGGGDGGCGGH